jgi:cellulose synthase/poly-beta-1,6-N-acetylglucosamine synthase-like glycosyltransferase
MSMSRSSQVSIVRDDTREEVTVSIIIKALNEERRIAACIESALKALTGLKGEVILADSGSTDGTIAIAARYPVKIVQLRHPQEKRCGIGPQLGYQFAHGKYVYILDGDMELDKDFIRCGVSALEREPSLAGVAGLREEQNAANVHFQSRKARNEEGVLGDVPCLYMGGLYRVAALRTVGYLSNRNLHSSEELELGLRLSSRGWTMRRLPIPGVRHFGHTDPTLRLQIKRWRSGYLLGPGEALRASLGKPYFWRLVFAQRHLILALGLWALLMIGIAVVPLTRIGLTCWFIAVGALFLQRLIKYKDASRALWMLALWHVDAIAMLTGFVKPQVDPMQPIEAVIVVDRSVEEMKRERTTSSAQSLPAASSMP